MCYHIVKDKPIQFQIVKIAKRQLIFNAYNFQMLCQTIIKPKDRNNNNYIMYENTILYKDTIKIKRFNLYFIKNLFHSILLYIDLSLKR